MKITQTNSHKFTTLGTRKRARGTQTASFPGAENFRSLQNTERNRPTNSSPSSPRSQPEQLASCQKVRHTEDALFFNSHSTLDWVLLNQGPEQCVSEAK